MARRTPAPPYYPTGDSSRKRKRGMNRFKSALIENCRILCGVAAKLSFGSVPVIFMGAMLAAAGFIKLVSADANALFDVYQFYTISVRVAFAGNGGILSAGGRLLFASCSGALRSCHASITPLEMFNLERLMSYFGVRSS